MKKESDNLPMEDQLFSEFCQTGDRNTFERFYHMVQPWLKRMVYRLCADADITCDILQDTWKTLLTVSDRYDPRKGRITNFIFTIARNTAFHHLRHAKRFSRMANGFDIEDNAPQQAETFETAEKAKMLRESISSLRESYQIVLLLHYYSSLEIKEIANMLNEPEGTIKTWLRRGRQQLAKILPVEIQ